MATCRTNTASDLEEGIAEAEKLVRLGKRVVRTNHLLFIDGFGYGIPVIRALEKRGLIVLSGPGAVKNIPLASV